MEPLVKNLQKMDKKVENELKNFPFQTNESIKSIQCGEYSSSILTCFGNVYSCGYNHHGQTGIIVTEADESESNNSHWERSLTRCDVYEWSKVQFKNLGNIRISQIAVGYDHQLFLSDDNVVYCCGNGLNGELGLGNQDSKKSPVVLDLLKSFSANEIKGVKIKKIFASNASSFMIDDNGFVYSSGFNLYGQLGLDLNLGQSEKFKRIPKAMFKGERINKVIVHALSYHTFFKTESGLHYVCGWNSNGQLGLEHDKNVKKPVEFTFQKGNVKEIVCGGFHSIMVTNDGKVYTWGMNDSGQLGLIFESVNVNKKKSKPTIVEIFVKKNIKIRKAKGGRRHSFFWSMRGDLYVCGRNEFEEIVLFPKNFHGMNKKNQKEFTIQRIPTLCTLSLSHMIKDVAVGTTHILYESSDGVFISGENEHGELGMKRGVRDVSFKFIECKSALWKYLQSLRNLWTNEKYCDLIMTCK